MIADLDAGLDAADSSATASSSDARATALRKKFARKCARAGCSLRSRQHAAVSGTHLPSGGPCLFAERSRSRDIELRRAMLHGVEPPTTAEGAVGRWGTTAGGKAGTTVGSKELAAHQQREQLAAARRKRTHSRSRMQR